MMRPTFLSPLLLLTAAVCAACPSGETAARAPERGSAEVPAALVGGTSPLVLVPVYVAGLGPYHFVLDTGASMCLVTPQVAHAAGVIATARRTGWGLGGRISIPVGVLSWAEIGGLRVRRLRVGIADELASLGASMRTEVDGVIGYNFLRTFRLTIDYREGRLRLERGVSAPEPDGLRFRLAPSRPLVRLRVRVNDEGPFEFVLDTGSQAVVLSRRVAIRAGVPVGEAVVAGFAAGGRVSTTPARADSMTVGTHTVGDLGVAVTDFLDSVGRAACLRVDGLVGSGFLRQFRLTIDYRARRLYLD